MRCDNRQSGGNLPQMRDARQIPQNSVNRQIAFICPQSFGKRNTGDDILLHAFRNTSHCVFGKDNRARSRR
jgi:hypothetical protein